MTEDKPKISELLDELEFTQAGLPPEVAKKAARAARLNREKKIKQVEPDAEAHRKEYEHLKS